MFGIRQKNFPRISDAIGEYQTHPKYIFVGFMYTYLLDTR